MRSQLIACLKDEAGTEVVEYALLLGLIVVGAIGLMSALGVRVLKRWQDVFDLL
jgi:Flp pilus assembly pilin Flp